MTDAVTAGGPRWFPAAGKRMGGDLYSVRPSPHGLRLLIGDVRGQGAAAAAGARVLLECFEARAPSAPTLEALVGTLEETMAGHTRQRRDGVGDEDFATAVAVEIRPDGRALRLINRGHPAPLLLRPGSVRALDGEPSGPPLGLGDLAPGAGSALTAPFPEDGTLLLVTDGTTEARNADGVFYDPVRRLFPHAGAGPEELVRLLRREVRTHVARRTGGRPADDMGLLALRASPVLSTADAPPRPATSTAPRTAPLS